MRPCLGAPLPHGATTGASFTYDMTTGTESSASVRGRIMPALDAIAARHPGARVVVVSHAGTINAALAAIARSERDFIFPLANTSISVVRINAGRRVILGANDTAHLRTVPSRGRA